MIRFEKKRQINTNNNRYKLEIKKMRSHRLKSFII